MISDDELIDEIKKAFYSLDFKQLEKLKEFGAIEAVYIAKTRKYDVLCHKYMIAPLLGRISETYYSKPVFLDANDKQILLNMGFEIIDDNR